MIRLASSAAILLLAAAAPAEDLIRSLPARPGGALHVVLALGSVEIRDAASPEVRVEARARGIGASAVHFATVQRGGDLVLTGSAEPWLDLLRSGPGVRVRIWVPRDLSVEVHASPGPIEVDDRRETGGRRYLAAR
jgi:hypothetical protein